MELCISLATIITAFSISLKTNKSSFCLEDFTCNPISWHVRLCFRQCGKIMSRQPKIFLWQMVFLAGLTKEIYTRI